MKDEGEYSQEKLHFFEMEGLTYNLETPASQSKLLQETGFIQVTTDDRSEWYRLRAQEELTMIQTELYPRMVELMGKNQADHFVENWHALTVVCDRGDLLQVYNRGHKPERETPSEDCVR